PTMSLSSSRSRMKRHTFHLTLDKNTLINDFTSQYEGWVEESKDDDEITGGPEPDDLIGQAGYPNLVQLLEKKDLVEMLIGWYFIEDIFNKYNCSNSGNIQYWFDQTEGALVSENSVTIYGECYSE
ncbi:hypothetical protein MNBD_GAMMA12-1653, partial [hydrothermal vent metagenome]